MKQKSHKLLSLLLTFALVFSLAPTAWAASNHSTHNSWNNWTVTKAATCTAAGERKRTCAVSGCGVEQTENIPATGHTWGTPVVSLPASCLDKGINVVTCSVCGATERRETPALGHNYTYKDDKNGTTHTATCVRSSCTVSTAGHTTTEAHKFGTNNTAATCSICGAANPNVSVSITLSQAPGYLQIGEKVTLTATTTPANMQVTWETSDPKIATVNGGVVEGIGEGTVTITATSGGKSATCNITVRRAASSTILSGPSSVSVDSDGWRQVTISTNSSDYNGYVVDWSITNGTGSIRLSRTESNYGVSASTTVSSRSTSVWVYGYSTGTAYLTATLRRTTSSAASDTLTIPVTVGRTTGYSLSPSPSNTSAVYLNYYNDRYWDYDYDYDYYYRYYRDFSVTPYYNSTSILNNSNYDITYTWTLNNVTQVNSSSSSRSYTLYASNSSLNRSGRSNTLTCSARIYDRAGNYVDNVSVSWTVYTDYYSTNDYSVSATVYDTSNGYALDERDDKGGSSIIDQMEGKLASNESISYVRFTDVTDTYGDLNASTGRDYSYSSSRGYDLREVIFTPDQVGRTGTATFSCTVYGTRSTVYSCTIRITVVSGGTSTGDITYNAAAGSSVDFKASDFRSWWRDNYSRGELDYVRFTSTSSGSLFANYNGSTGSNVVSSSSATSCYYNPGSRQTGIDDLTFVPGSSSTSSVTIRFTAYGTTSTTSSSNTSLSGRVVITYSNASASTINYSTTGTKSINLSASDFTSRYRDVMGASAPSNMTIRFRSVPSNGNLTIGSTTLSSSNISSYYFASSSSGSNRISDVKYTPKSNSNSSDSVKYDCYTGSTLRFSGTITFTNRAESTVTTGVTVSYSTTGANVTFNATDFIVGKGTAMASSNYLVFGTPSSGSLYVGSTPLASGSQVSYVAASGKQLLGNVSYHPAAGFNGTASVSFTAYNSNGTQAATGVVNIQVTQAAVTQPTTPVRTSFSDVPSNAWYYNDVTTLAKANIVNGRNDGLFHPNDAVNYGEALKLILLAAGYPTQTEISGSAWAQNYLNLAIAQGLLPGSASDYTLSQSMNRTTIATVAAKALKLTPVTNEASPYADTSDSYVLALTKAGIVQGDSSSGKQLWSGDDNLTRAQISRIVYNVYKYRNVTPGSSSGSSTGSTNTTVDTNKPNWLN